MEGIQQKANSLEMLDNPVQHRGALGNFYNQNFLPVTNSVSFANLKNQKYCSIVATSKFWNFQYGIQLFKIFYRDIGISPGSKTNSEQSFSICHWNFKIKFKIKLN